MKNALFMITMDYGDYCKDVIPIIMGTFCGINHNYVKQGMMDALETQMAPNSFNLYIHIILASARPVNVTF